MLDLYNLYLSVKDKPLTWTTLVAITVFIIDKLQKRFIARYLRKLFNLTDTNEVKQYVENQKRIESKIDLLLKESGVKWAVQDLTNELKVGVKRKNILFRYLHQMRYRVGTAAKFIQSWWNPQMPINKAILVPLLASIATFAKQVWGVEIGNENIDLAATALIWIISAIGIFMHPRKKKGTVNDGISDTFERTE